ncbi:MAG TPA: hypothetical protein VM536_15025 [Chloroflexia bacterium]|nr:hypothetical protein [Chloroflexia bacterium]
MSEAARRRVAEVVGAVARQALADSGAERIALLDDGGPEAELAAALLAEALGPDRVLRVSAGAAEVESVLHLGPGVERARAGEEAARLRARLLNGVLLAHPGNKTALLLAGMLPPEPFLPLGDLWASQVATLGGAWSAPAQVRALAEGAGGIAVLDASLAALLEGRAPDALGGLPEGVAAAVEQALAAGRAGRLNPRLVPKLGTRTLGCDLNA